jgi:ABC-type lipoprotein export system ATPase subunit
VLKNVVIENYRSCLHTSIDLDPHLSVLIGPNGSGKTNILQAIMLLHRLALDEALGRARKDAAAVASRIKAVFQQRNVRTHLNALVAASTDESNHDIVSSSRQRWTFRGEDGRRAAYEVPLGTALRLRFGGMEHGYFRYHTHSGFRMVDVDAEMPKWTRNPLTKIAEYCSGIRYYGASQFTNPGTCPSSFQIEEQEGQRRRLTRFRGHEKVLYGMYSAQKASSQRYTQFLEIVGPRGLRLIDNLTFREVRTSSIDYSVRVGGKLERRKRNRVLVIPQFKIGKQKLSPNQLSEGTFKTLALLFHVITDEGTLLLVEEPEVCVHHGLLSSILELIKTSSRHKQMILSTHSDYVLDHVKPENVYGVTFEKSAGTIARHVPKSMTKREYRALREYLSREGNLGEYWREGGLGDRP